MMKQWILGCAALLAAGAASGQIFECIDAKGNREFAQACPAGTVKERQMKSSAGPASGGSVTPPAGKTLSEKDAEFRKRGIERQEAEAKAAKDQAEAAQYKRNCDDARSQLRQLQEGQRIARTDPNTGERVFLEDKDRPGEIANAQKSVENWCSKK